MCDSLSFKFQAKVFGKQDNNSASGINEIDHSDGPVQETINDAPSNDFNMTTLNVLALLDVENQEDRV